MWCPILADRRNKFEMIMRAMAKGFPYTKLCEGPPPDDGSPLVIYGQGWGSEHLLARAKRDDLDYLHVDNGYWKPGRGRPDGYYRLCWRGFYPRFLADAKADRFEKLKVILRPWRTTGKHVLLGLPGEEYGQGLGWNMREWIEEVKRELPKRTDRPIVIRPRVTDAPLEDHLKDCWAVVTHSSNIAVDAVTAGIPAIVAEDSPASPVADTSWDDVENPKMPDRRQWMSSLADQQFTVAEMSDGTAYRYMTRIMS